MDAKGTSAYVAKVQALEFGSWAVHAGMFSIQYRPTPDSEGKPLEADFNLKLFLAGSNAGKLCYEFHYCSPDFPDKNKARVQLDISSITGLQENAANNTLMLQLSRPPTVEMGLQAFVEKDQNMVKLRTKYSHKDRSDCSNGVIAACSRHTVQLARAATMRTFVAKLLSMDDRLPALHAAGLPALAEPVLAPRAAAPAQGPVAAAVTAPALAQAAAAAAGAFPQRPQPRNLCMAPGPPLTQHAGLPPSALAGGRAPGMSGVLVPYMPAHVGQLPQLQLQHQHLMQRQAALAASLAWPRLLQQPARLLLRPLQPQPHMGAMAGTGNAAEGAGKSSGGNDDCMVEGGHGVDTTELAGSGSTWRRGGCDWQPSDPYYGLGEEGSESEEEEE